MPEGFLGIVDPNKEPTAEYKKIRQRELSDIRAVLKSPEGRRFIWKLLSDAGIFRSSFSQNAMQTSFMEGQRDNGLRLLHDVNEAEPNAFARMQAEYLSEQKSKKEATENKQKKEE